MLGEGRIASTDWDLYDTRHAVYTPRQMSAEQLEAGYWRAYRQFYRWGSIFQAARSKPGMAGFLRHLAYAGGWKKFEPVWDWVIRLKRVTSFLPLLESVLAGFGEHDFDTGERIQPGRISNESETITF